MATILIADDDTPLLNLLVRCLKRAGNYTIKTASNGREALDLMQQGGIDAVIFDNSMPELHGLQAAGLAHISGILPPGILHSAEEYVSVNGTDYCIHQAAKESGLYGAVSKPSSVSIWQGVVADLLTARTETPRFDNLRRYFAEEWNDKDWQPPQAQR